MKRLTIISASLLTIGILSAGNNTVSAQDKKLSIGVNIGANMPMSGFGKTDSNMLPIAASNKDTNNLSGYAKTGFHFDLIFNLSTYPASWHYVISWRKHELV